MKIEITRVTDWQRVVDAARFTQGKKSLGREPSDTKYKVRITPKRIQNAMYHLRQKYGYFYETVDKTVLYYDSQTRRVKNENYYTEKYGISFIQADE